MFQIVTEAKVGEIESNALDTDFRTLITRVDRSSSLIAVVESVSGVAILVGWLSMLPTF
jgi:hypothetical protein